MKWKKIDWDALNVPKKDVFNGVEMTVFYSPYDMPIAIGVGLDDTKSKLLVAFRYISDLDEMRDWDESGPVRIGVGAKSHKVHMLEIDVAKLSQNPDAVVNTIAKVIGSMRPSSDTQEKVGHFSAVRDAFEINKEQVLQGLR